MFATKEENDGMWRVVVMTSSGHYSTLSYRDRTEWKKRTAVKHAAEFKAIHLRDAWAEPVQ